MAGSRDLLQAHHPAGALEGVQLSAGLIQFFVVSCSRAKQRPEAFESIPGFTVQLDAARFEAVLADHGMVMAGQSASLAPADRRLYALRDATGTVPAVPLITSSIMSKKLAEDLDGLVLDIKIGSGAFMKDVESGTELARTMVGIGR